MSVRIDLDSATGRATCKVGNHKIPKDIDEVIIKVGSRYPIHQCLSCFKEEHWGFIHELYNSFTDAEFEDLNRTK